MSNTNPGRVLGPIDPNPYIIVPSETLIESILNPSSPLETKPPGSWKKDVEFTSRESSRLEAQLINVSKRQSRSSPRSKSDVDCLRRNQTEAAIGEGQSEVLGQTANERPPFPSAIKIEPGLQPHNRFRIDDIKPTELSITPPSPSNLEPSSTTFIPTVKVEIKKELAHVVDVAEEVREIVLGKKKAVRVKVVSFAPSECWLSCQDSS